VNEGARYVRLVEWSDEDRCFIGSCPELFYGGCHGDDPRAVFDELCHMIEEAVELYRRDRRSLPSPLSGKDFVNAMQRIA
jgi:predicted RNase H-like HicB family nuclease